MLGIAHIINPVVVPSSSDLFIAQPVTFESMRLAKEYAAGNVSVELFTAQYPEDVRIIPNEFTTTKNLDRSVLDVGAFSSPRKLPLVKDILDRLYEESDADYLIYTNADIALMPYFYSAVARLCQSGVDAMVINRRTISKKPCLPSELPLMWAQAGERHPGYDCFVFRRELYPRLDLGLSCIGANWIGRVLLANLCDEACRFMLLEDQHLTFHLGDDRSWKSQQFLDYDHHNLKILTGIMTRIKDKGGLEGKPLLEKFYRDIFADRGKPQQGVFTKLLQKMWRD